MRHKVSGKKFNRDTNHRRSMLKNLVQDLVVNEHLETTVPKAKVTIRQTEKIINKAKNSSIHTRRQIISSLFDKKVAHKIVDVLAPRYADKPGGFVKMLRLGRRRGDNTMIARLELVKEPAKAADQAAKKEAKK
jgi:large subunit ribosomal protein L17